MNKLVCYVCFQWSYFIVVKMFIYISYIFSKKEHIDFYLSTYCLLLFL